MEVKIDTGDDDLAKAIECENNGNIDMMKYHLLKSSKLDYSVGRVLVV